MLIIYLQIFSVSTMILFKCPFAISRNTTDMFKRFQIGENYFGGKNEEKEIFQVCISINSEVLVGLKKLNYIFMQTLFCIIIKDVPENDVEAIQDEFVQK